MGYYLRVFCLSGPHLPARADVRDWAQANEVSLTVHPESHVGAASERSWSGAEIDYKAERLPIIVEVNDRDDLLREELDEFTALLEDVPNSPAKARVRTHLRSTSMVVAAQLASDGDEETLNVVTAFLEFLASRCNGMIQADGEGFYEDSELILEMP